MKQKKKLTILAAIVCLIILIDIVIYFTFGMLYIEHQRYYIWDPTNVQREGEFVPNFAPYTDSYSVMLFPFLINYVWMSSDYKCEIVLSDFNQTEKYDNLDYVVFTFFQIDYENGEVQTIIPGIKAVPYYVEQKEASYIPAMANVEQIKFKLNRDSYYHHERIGLIDIKDVDSFAVIIKGKYKLIDGKEETFYFRERYDRAEGFRGP